MAYGEAGNLTNAGLLDCFLPTAVETPSWETDFYHHAVAARHGAPSQAHLADIELPAS